MKDADQAITALRWRHGFIEVGWTGEQRNRGWPNLSQMPLCHAKRPWRERENMGGAVKGLSEKALQVRPHGEYFCIRVALDAERVRDIETRCRARDNQTFNRQFMADQQVGRSLSCDNAGEFVTKAAKRRGMKYAAPGCLIL